MPFVADKPKFVPDAPVAAAPEAPLKDIQQETKPSEPTSLLGKVAGPWVGQLETGLKTASSVAALPVEATASLYQLATAPAGEKATRASEASQGVARALTYEPRTAAGQQEAKVVGKVMGAPSELGEALQGAVSKELENRGIPKTAMTTAVIARMVPEVLATLAGGKVGEAAMRTVAPAEAATAAEDFVRTKTGLDWQSLPQAFKDRLTAAAKDPKQLEGLDPAAVEREARSMKLGLPMTRGQITRDPHELNAEERLSKKEGQDNPVREAHAAQDKRLHQLVDEVKKDTGAKASTRQAVGKSVQNAALRPKMAVSKANYDALYDTARKTEPEAAVPPGALYDLLKLKPHIQRLQWMQSWLKREGIMTKAKEGISTDTSLSKALTERGKGAKVVPQMRNVRLNELDDLRKDATSIARKGGPDAHYAGEVLKAIDKLYDKVPQAATAWRAAINAFKAHKIEFEDQGLVKSLSGMRRKSRVDRATELAKTTTKVLKSSAEQIRKLRDTLTQGGTPKTRVAGEQAWRDLQGSVLEALRKKAQGKREIVNEHGQSEFNSPFRDTFKELDEDGKIDALFTPRQAARLREIYEAVGDVRTKPSARIAGSPTAANLAALSPLERASEIPGLRTLAGTARWAGSLGRIGKEIRAGARAKTSPIAEAAQRANAPHLTRRVGAMAPFTLQQPTPEE